MKMKEKGKRELVAVNEDLVLRGFAFAKELDDALGLGAEHEVARDEDEGVLLYNGTADANGQERR